MWGRRVQGRALAFFVPLPLPTYALRCLDAAESFDHKLGFQFRGWLAPALFAYV